MLFVVMHVGFMVAMNNDDVSKKAPIIVLPPRFVESTPRSSNDFTSPDISPRSEPKLLSENEIQKYIEELPSENRKLYLVIVAKYTMNNPLEYQVGFGLYNDGLAIKKISEFVGMPQYYLCENFINILKRCTRKDGSFIKQYSSGIQG